MIMMSVSALIALVLALLLGVPYLAFMKKKNVRAIHKRRGCSAACTKK